MRVKSRGSTSELPSILPFLSPEEVSGIPSVEVKSSRLTGELPLILVVLSYSEVDRICSVAVKCIDIRRNTSGEGGSLAHY